MGTIKLNIIFVFLSLFVSFYSFAVISKFRIIINDDPSTTATIAYHSDNVATTVYYGTTNQGTNISQYSNSQGFSTSNTKINTNTANFNNVFTRLTNLQPKTNYYFIVMDNVTTELSDVYYFETASNDPNDPISLIAGGDSRGGTSGGNSADAIVRINGMQLIAKLKPHAVLFAGDMIDNGSNTTEWSNWFDEWQYTIGADGRITPIMPAIGNHESNELIMVNLFDTSADVYYRNKFSGNLLSVYALNSEMQIPGDQTDWLENKLLEDYDSKWKIAFYHRGMRPHVSFKPEGINQYAYWSELFYEHNVNLVVESDSHVAKRTFPVAPCASGLDCFEGFRIDNNNGTVYTGEGSFGAPLRNPDDGKPWTRDMEGVHQINWIFVYPNKMEVRSVLLTDPSNITEVDINNRFTPPTDLMIWNPSNGDIIEILEQNSVISEIEIVAPALNQTFHNLQIPIEINASSVNGIDEVTIYINGVQETVLNNPPYNYTYNASNYGIYNISAIASDNTNIPSVLVNTAIQIEEQILHTIDKNIYESYNDIVEKSDGSISSNPMLLYIGLSSNTINTTALRFDNVHIPSNAIIDSAYLQFTASGLNNGATLRIKCIKDAFPEPFGTAANNISNRDLTINVVNWTTPSWQSNYTGLDSRTPELKTIVQELVNLNDFDAGSPLSFVIESLAGTASAKSADRAINNEDSTLAPLLHLVYHVNNIMLQAPNVNITNPVFGNSYLEDSVITISINNSDNDGNVASLSLMVDLAVVQNIANPDSIETYNYTFDTPGNYDIQVMAIDNDGQSSLSPIVNITIDSLEIAGCETPTNLQTFFVENSSAGLVWDPVIGAVNYLIEYKPCTSLVWTSATAVSNFYNPIFLPGCSCIEARVTANCQSSSSSQASPIINFETTGCVTCPKILGLVISNIEQNSAVISWDLLADADYSLLIKESSNAYFDTVARPFPLAILFTLPNCTSFDWAVITNCDNGLSSEMSDINTFSTLCVQNEFDGDHRKPELISNEEMTVFPNPIKDELNIFLNIDDNIEKSKLKIYNSSGEIVYQKENNLQNRTTTKINFKNFVKGVYYIEYTSNEKRLIRKVVK